MTEANKARTVVVVAILIELALPGLLPCPLPLPSIEISSEVNFTQNIVISCSKRTIKETKRPQFWKTLTTVATIFTFWPPASDGTVHLCLSFTPVEDIKKTTSYLNVIVSFSSRLVWVTLALFSPPGHPKNLEPPTEMQNTWCSFHDKKLKVKEKKTAPPLAKLPTNLSSESLACNQQMVDMIASID